MFADRKEAGQKLAEKLLRYRGKDAVVLALPRGGVVVGYEIAKALKLPLDIMVTRKIGHPNNPEYAIGAVDENGALLLNEAECRLIEKEWLKNEVEKQKNEASRRIRAYRGGREPSEIKGKTAIITDDGIATGLSMRLAIKVVKEGKPERIIVAVPVAPYEITNELKNNVDELIVLLPPKEFGGAVGAHYKSFEQVPDAEVVRLLEASAAENEMV